MARRTTVAMSEFPADILKKLNNLLIFKINWLQNYDEALEKAFLTSGDQSRGAQIVMAFFTGRDWCPHCQDLTTEVFNTREFRLWFNSHLMIPLLLDYPQNPDDISPQNARLKNQYIINGFPTVVAIKTTGGYCTPNGQCVVNTSEVGRIEGYMRGTGVDSWITSFAGAANIQR